LFKYNPDCGYLNDTECAYWFLFKDDYLLVKKGSLEQTALLKCNKIDLSNIRIHFCSIFEHINGIYCIYGEIDDSFNANDFQLERFRVRAPVLPIEIFNLTGRAFQLVNWERTHQFCGQCGNPMVKSTKEFAMHCPNCGIANYPRISPAVIVAIIKEKKLLLARRKEFEMNSLIAGYVEAGETLEEAVNREVKEEVGLNVKNIRYFSSQPWAFSYSLMVAFIADYESGDIQPDGIEIEFADWYSTDNLPDKIPGHLSIARKMIDAFCLMD
jgi:NAD+ diphosphatase